MSGSWRLLHGRASQRDGYTRNKVLIRRCQVKFFEHAHRPSQVFILPRGVGAVGGGLCRLLAGAGARLVVADVDAGRAAALAAELGATVAGIDEIFDVPADVFAPCALGGVLNEHTIPRLTAKVVCGGANNQLGTERHGELLLERGILYAPDYVVNAGGIINVSAEYLGESADQVQGRVRQIAPRLLDILKQADAERRPSSLVADELARSIIAAGRAERGAPPISAVA